MSLLSPILQSVLSPISESISGAVSRYFTTFDAVAQSYILLSSDVGIPSSTDYEIEFDVIPDGTTQVVIGKKEGVNPRVRILSNGDIQWEANNSGGTIVRTPSNLEVGKLNRVRLVKSGLSTSIIVNGVQAGTQETVGIDAANFNQLGRAFNFPPSGGRVSDLKAWSGGDRDTGSLIFDMPINQNYTPTNNTVIDLSGNGNNGTFVNVADGDSTLYTQNSDGDWVGENLVENGGFSSTSGWDDTSQGTGTAQITAGRAIVTGTTFANRGQLSQSIDTTAGQMYRVTFTCLQDQTAFIVVSESFGGSLEVFNIPSEGAHSFTFTATTSSTDVVLRSQGGESIFDDVTVEPFLEVAY
ncbi:hypothetical protein [Alteromonas phage PB15]|nr:hypothetical protein [Alteromonas phage PB15]